MTSDNLLTRIDPDGVARLTLNRPEIHNAFDDALVAELTATLKRLDADPQVRVIVLTGSGQNFSGGADLNWMRRIAVHSERENPEDSIKLAELMQALDSFSKPTIAAVRGAAVGGAVGLVACCDIATATEEASFRFSEVRLGLIPAVISPYVIAAIGPRQARRYFLTAERISAHEAHRLGLVHEVVSYGELEESAQRMAREILRGAPAALVAGKQLVAEVARRPIDEPLRLQTAERIAALRASPEGREGVAAFLEKRKPSWQS